MNLWLFSDGAIVGLILFSTIFCEQGLSSEMNVTTTQITEIPDSLNGTEESGGEDGNSTQLASHLPVSQESSNPSYNFTSTPCSAEGCSASDEPEINATSNEMLDTTINSLLNVNNLTENPLTTAYFTSQPNETSTSDNNSTFEVHLKTEGLNETVSNTLDAYTSTPLMTTSGNPLLYDPEINSTIQVLNTSLSTTTTPDLSNTSSSFANNVSEGFSLLDNSTSNATTFSSIPFTEENDTNIETITESTVTSIFDDLSNISKVTNFTESISSTETSDDIFTLFNVTNNGSDASSPTTEETNQSFDNITGMADGNSTESVSPVTDPQTTDNSVTDITTDFTDSLLNVSDSVTENATTEETNPSTETTSESLIDIVTMTSTELPSTPRHKSYIVIELRINCSGNEKEIALSVAQLLNTTLRDQYENDCSVLHNITLSVSQDAMDNATVYRVLSDKLDNAKLVRVIYSGDSANMTSKNVTLSDSDVTESEMILYITLGVCLGAIFLIALVIICFKCCRQRPSKPVDLDVPHLNLRLEDYTLTRIPRPNTVYLDYFRGPIVSDRYATAPLGNSMNAASGDDRGLVQSFDTSVVPLEDAKKLDDLGTSPGRTSSTCPSTPLRTFGRKDWKHGDNLIYENVISSSTEKLHPDFYKFGYPGMENPTFAA